MNFTDLVSSIRLTHQILQEDTVKAVNRNLTVRNWLLGYYIVTYEQGGEDRAAYGEGLLQKLAERLDKEGFSYRNLKLYRQFYQTYSHLGSVAFPLLQSLAPIGQTLSAQLEVLPVEANQVGVPSQTLVGKLSFSHLVELLPMEDPLKRAFYEVECIKGNWSIRELRRQIDTLYFERMGLSRDLEKLSDYVQAKAVQLTPKDVLQSPYTFEFLGLKARDVLPENELETALLDNLQDFLLELGNGFCLEARQKRILIGDEYFFVDMVMYHRLLRCHVLIELKTDAFRHEYLGQLNSYLGYYRKEVMMDGENPPVGILLVTNQNKILVEYATAGLDNRLFVQQYLIELPSKEKLRQFIQSQL